MAITPQTFARIGGAGDLRQRLEFYQPASADDGYGNVTAGWTLMFTASAQITPRLGGETVQAARLAGRQPVTIVLRHSANSRAIRTDWKAKDVTSGAEYNVRAVTDPNLGTVEHGKWIEVLAESGVAIWSEPLVLSLFPGIGLLDMAFEAEGFCIVRGPDLLWGGDVRAFHPPAGRFEGVIGGPPCQAHSKLGHLSMLGNGVPGGHRHGDMIPEFSRVVAEAAPDWFLSENVKQAPLPEVAGYTVADRLVNNRWLGQDQNRLRRFCFGTRDGRALVIDHEVFDSAHFEPAVLAGHGSKCGQPERSLPARDWVEMARLQGLPPAWVERVHNEQVLSVHGFKKFIGNGVPLPMGRAVARAVIRATRGVEAAA